MKQLQDEAQKSRQTELRSQKAIAQLEKQQRVKDGQIQSLEADRKQKETVLKRKLEEVCPAQSCAAPCFLRINVRCCAATSQINYLWPVGHGSQLFITLCSYTRWV